LLVFLLHNLQLLAQALLGINAAKQAMLVIRESFTPLIGRPVEDGDDLRELEIDIGASGYIALYRFESALDAGTILEIRHQLENDYK